MALRILSFLIVVLLPFNQINLYHFSVFKMLALFIRSEKYGVLLKYTGLSWYWLLKRGNLGLHFHDLWTVMSLKALEVYWTKIGDVSPSIRWAVISSLFMPIFIVSRNLQTIITTSSSSVGGILVIMKFLEWPYTITIQIQF